MNFNQVDLQYKIDISNLVDNIQCLCFGDWKNTDTHFHIPLPESEAGSSQTSQRRYLFTDSFGILTFISQAKLLREISQENDKLLTNTDDEYHLYLSAACKLIISVYETLGNPASDSCPMTFDDRTARYKGLCIGKSPHT